MDKASQVLAQGVPVGMPKSYRALADHSGAARSTLHHRAQGRPSLKQKAEGQQYLTPWEERALLKFLLQTADFGQPVRIKSIPSLAYSVTQQRPPTNRPVKPPGRHWAKAFEKRHLVLQARRVKALDWNRHEKNIYTKITHGFEVIGKVLQDPVILAENVYNMDETGVMLSMPGSVKVLTGKDDVRGYRGVRIKRNTVTAIECISADGRYLTPMIIWPATTYRSNWTTFPTPGWQYACSESGYTDSKISLEWLKQIFDPQTKERANQKPRVLICDGFGTHETLEILEYCFENNLVLCRLPSHTSHKLQPCDVAVFATLKSAYREQVDRLERGGVNAIGKEHFTSLYSGTREIAFTPKNIKAGFAACGLVPFNPDRVLRGISKPLAELTIPKGDEVKVGLCPQDKILQTPVTPVSEEALISLQNLIIKQDAYALDETSKQSLQRHVQKLTNATQMSFAKGALQQYQIQFLTTINNEAKVRRSTNSVVLGKAKVMSYEDLVAKRAEREAKEQNKVKVKGKRKCDRKRKSPEEAGAPELKAKVARMSETQVDENGITPEPLRAPVARMW